MQGIVRDDKNLNGPLSPEGREEDAEKDRKIKRLTLINRELIETLKLQNDELTKKISKQRLKGGRSTGKSAPKENKDLESIRKELSNAYKQIDMYKDIVQNLKAKEVSLDNVDRIYELENKVKVEDAVIENLQREIKYLVVMREKQEKQIKIFENDDMKEAKAALAKEIADYKQKIKNLKKNAAKREEVEKRQHAYYVELEKALRKANDEYYPGKTERKEIKQNDDEIHENQWQSVKDKVSELRKLYQQNNKRLDMINRQKLRELKSFQQNQLKLKQKMRKLNTLKSRIAELGKLTVIKESKEVKEQPKLEPLPKREEIVKNDKNKEEREVKKWNVPEGFCMEKGKVLPNSAFFSDKNIIGNQHKYKVVEVNVWTDGYGIPCLLRFVYEDEEQQLIEGKQMADSIPQTLEMHTFSLKEKDYLWHISGKFSHGILISLTLKSKLGQQVTYCDENSSQPGDPFNFFSQPNQIPSCFFGATIRPSENQLKICYLGCEFMSDW